MAKGFGIIGSAAAALSLATALLVTGCGLWGLKPEGDGRTGSLRLAVAGMHPGSRSVVADPSRIAIDSYSIRLESHNGHPTRSLVSTTSLITFSDLELGTWDIRVDALKDSGIVGHGEALDQTVTAGWPLDVSVNLAMTQDGTGGFSLPVSFPASTGIDYVRGTLSTLDGNVYGSPLVPTIDTLGDVKACVFSMLEVPSGAYILSMDFRRGGEAGTPAGIFGESVNVRDNVVADRWINPTQGGLEDGRAFSAENFFSANANLAGISVSDQSGLLALSPGFSSSVFDYEATSGSPDIFLSAVHSIAGQSLAYSLDNGTTWESLVSGTASIGISLDPAAATEIIVRSTAPDGATRREYGVSVRLVIPVAGMSLNRSIMPLAVGGSARILAATIPGNATDGSIAWRSLDDSIATIAEDGTVRGIAAGSTTIVATSNDGGFSASVRVSVYPVIAVSNAPTRLAGYPGFTPARDGTGASGAFSDPAGLCALKGAIYIADSGAIRRFDPSTGILSTLAGAVGLAGGTSRDGIGGDAVFHDTKAICTDGEYLYVTEGQGTRLVRRIDPDSAEVVTIAGPDDFGGQLAGICADGSYLYVAEIGAIKRIDLATLEVTSLCGLSGDRRFLDGDLATARFSFLYGLTALGGKIYAQDGQCLRLVDLVAGTVSRFEPIPSAYPPVRDLGVLAKDGFLYLGQRLSHNYYGTIFTTSTLERFALEDAVSGANRELIAGYDGIVMPNQSADGAGRSARFGAIQGMDTIGDILYLIDSGNKTLRSVDLSNLDEPGGICAVVTLSGAVGARGSNDGAADIARFNAPAGISAIGDYCYIADRDNVTLRRYSLVDGEVTTVSGSPGIFTGMDADFSGLPVGLCERDGQLYVLDYSGTVCRVEPGDGSLTVALSGVGNRGLCTDGKDLYTLGTRNVIYRNSAIFAGADSAGGFVDGVGSDARFNSPGAITSDGVYLYVADSGNKAVRKIDILTREVSTVKVLADSASLTGIATDGARLYVADASERLYVITLDSGACLTSTSVPYALGVYLHESGLIASSTKNNSGAFSNTLLRLR